MRYLPLTPDDRKAMLAAIGVPSIEALYRDVPADVLLTAPVDLPLHRSEMEVEAEITALARKNLGTSQAPSFLGAGAYRHHTPAAVDYLIQRGEFLTSYTPYQPEVAQGTLQYLFEFQTQVALLTGMEIANASMYDGATATAEAAMMANRVTRRSKVIMSSRLHPHYRETVETAGRHTGFAATVAPGAIAGDEDLAALLDEQTSCVIVQYPDFYGNIQNFSALADAAHRKGALLIVAVTEIVALGALMAPGDMGADIVAAEGQSLGNSLGFGGPYVGLFAVREKYVRQMPGRLVGETFDVDGRRGYVLTLSTREQHIRREKATSNICTNSGLCALAFAIHLTLLGETGLRALAAFNHARAVELAARLARVPGATILNRTYFNEFTVRLARPALDVVEKLAARGILAGVPVARLLPHEPEARNLLLVAATELTTEADMDALCDGLRSVS
ncbi:MAG TPA: aminomethyl-transferring glycine dehydrogenase subunit GcvPA [Dongiaceae bacterium]|nr:aminomethyl-transferring glycine dehydrogenase subunit GcvPA [Dongiaceae bacterium]